MKNDQMIACLIEDKKRESASHPLSYDVFLTLSQTSPGFYVSAVDLQDF